MLVKFVVAIEVVVVAVDVMEAIDAAVRWREVRHWTDPGAAKMEL